MEENNVSSQSLMKKAGKKLACEILKLCKRTGYCRVIFLIGKGSNGGDGVCACKELEHSPCSLEIITLCKFEELKRDVKDVWKRVKNVSKTCFDMHVPLLFQNCIIVDCLLGIGFHGGIDGRLKYLIEQINHSASPVIAADLPSGLNPDTGEVCELSVQADVTVTFGCPKKGLFLKDGPQYTGKVVVVDIGIPYKYFETCMDALDITTRDDIRCILHSNKLKADTYKGKRGHVLILGASLEYPFAPYLSAEAALRSKAGLVTLVTPGGLPHPSKTSYSIILKETSDAYFFTKSSLDIIQKHSCQSIGLGPGIGRNEETKDFLETFLRGVALPVVLDADALTLISQSQSLMQALKHAAKRVCIILTPHEGEMKRLEAALSLNSDLPRHVRAVVLSKEVGAYVVFKGVHSVIAAPDSHCTINLCDSPVLATAGSGDILTGLVASHLANCDDPFEACRVACFVHGFAGYDACFGGLPHYGIIADDILSHIPAAYSKIMYENE